MTISVAKGLTPWALDVEALGSFRGRINFENKTFFGFNICRHNGICTEPEASVGLFVKSKIFVILNPNKLGIIFN